MASADGFAASNFHNDRLGTPLRLTSGEGAEPQGRTVWRAEYRPFGELESVHTDADGDGSAVEQLARFPGQYDEALFGVLGLNGPYYNHHRWYEPATGRYLQPEPMLDSAEFVRLQAQQGRSTPTYAYALNNPMYYTDPDGRYVAPPLPLWPLIPIFGPPVFCFLNPSNVNARRVRWT